MTKFSSWNSETVKKCSFGQANGQERGKKAYYLHINETIAYDPGNFVSPEPDKLFHARKEVRMALKQSHYNS